MLYKASANDCHSELNLLLTLAPRIRTIHAGLNNIATIAPNLASTVSHFPSCIDDISRSDKSLHPQVPHLETLGEEQMRKEPVDKFIDMLTPSDSFDIQQPGHVRISPATRQLQQARTLVVDRQPSEESKVLQRMGHMEGTLFLLVYILPYV